MKHVLIHTTSNGQCWISFTKRTALRYKRHNVPSCTTLHCKPARRLSPPLSNHKQDRGFIKRPGATTRGRRLRGEWRTHEREGHLHGRHGARALPCDWLVPTVAVALGDTRLARIRAPAPAGPPRRGLNENSYSTTSQIEEEVSVKNSFMGKPAGRRMASSRWQEV